MCFDICNYLFYQLCRIFKIDIFISLSEFYLLWSSKTLLEKAMAPHSSTLAWKISWMEEPGRLQSMESLKVDMTEQLHFHFSLSCIGEGNGNLLQCSCLENPRDGGAWWAAVYGIAQSRTRLKQLSSSSQKPYSRNVSCFSVPWYKDVLILWRWNIKRILKSC